DALALHKGFNFLQSAPASSDISVWQFLGPLLTGGKTVIVDTETVCNPEQLFNVIKAEQLTLVELVPIVLRGLIEHSTQLLSDQRLLPDLSLMMVTGEYVPVELVNQWLQLYPDIKVANAYGPTEAADDISQAIIDAPLPTNQRTVPIGNPLANLKLYVLDAQMQLVPVGAPGEICVSGIGVGNGYWQNEEKTQLSFLPNPFAVPEHPLPNNNKDLIYRTGDLGRWLPDGNLEFLGRIDNQVKIRGFRIELGEIESLLSQHLSVQEAVVLVREDTPGNKILVAYIVEVEASKAPTIDLTAQLRKFLQERLPEHIVPSAFMQLKSLPLTPSGKIDRRALPAPSRDELTATYVPPTTPIQESITEMWQQILEIETVGIHDNFFELGGHSLLITQL
ncbi:MAG: non-ribosomal peptide synthetase, partial [Cyanobacteria bacterium J06656_5]